jgi:hypothetical protein
MSYLSVLVLRQGRGECFPPFGVWDSLLGATLLADPRIDLVAIKPPFIEDFLGRYFALSGKLVKRSFADLQIVRKLFDGHDGTGHLDLSSHSLAVDRDKQKAKKIPIWDVK